MLCSVQLPQEATPLPGEKLLSYWLTASVLSYVVTATNACYQCDCYCYLAGVHLVFAVLTTLIRRVGIMCAAIAQSLGWLPSAGRASSACVIDAPPQLAAPRRRQQNKMRKNEVAAYV